MRIQNIGRTIVRVAGLSIAPGRVGTIDANHWRGWLNTTAHQETAARSLLVLPDEPTDAELNRETRIYIAVSHLRRDNSEAWTQSGIPAIRHLESVTGYDDISGDERDAAWERYKEEHGDPNDTDDVNSDDGNEDDNE